MRRRLFTIASAVSIVLCVATIGLWARGSKHKLAFVFMNNGVLWELTSHDGRLWLDNEPERAELRSILLRKMNEATGQPMQPQSQRSRQDPELYQLILQLCGRAGLLTNPTPLVSHAFPCGAVVAATSILPIAWLALVGLPHYRNRINRRLRLRGGSCLNCGYDLRASPERCPECGTVVEGKSMPLKAPGISH